MSYLAAVIFHPTTLSPPQFSADLALSQTATSVGVVVSLQARGLPANQRFGFHIHEFGDTSDVSGLNLGSHFNPTNASHGCPAQNNNANTTHYGDLGSISSDSNGVAIKTWMLPRISLIDKHALGFVLGRGIVIHEKEDDCTTQPSGGKGGRLVQGTIVIKDFQLKDTSFDSANDAVAVFRDNDIFDQVVKGQIRAVKRKPADPMMLVLDLDGLSEQATYQIALHPFGVSFQVFVVNVILILQNKQ
ncbi:UNVERIFIED_CONTAM: hypothetical protein HDU68_006687 [Siphonaria sp. JEL0065]|nr:hypothetical protein HDU68_006687 [Siphonaria sp. JEL0065]